MKLQGSLSRALGLRPRSEKASPSSSSDTGSLASQYMSSVRSNSPPPPQLPPRPAAISGRRHRRVKSIGDIEYISSAAVSTPVWQEGRPQHSGPYRSLSERGYSSSHYDTYIGYSNVMSSDYYQQSPSDSYYQLQTGYYSPQNSGPPFPVVQRYGSLAEESWPPTASKENLHVKSNSRSYMAWDMYWISDGT